MSTGTLSFLTYVWHYLLARLIYDQLVRPLTHGGAAGPALVVLVAGAAFAAGRLTRRRA